VTAWKVRKTTAGKVYALDMANGETRVILEGGKPLQGQMYGMSPENARKLAAALTDAADEVEAAIANRPLTLFDDEPGGEPAAGRESLL